MHLQLWRVSSSVGVFLMKTYKFRYIMHEPSESTEPDKYMGEIPIIPGCRVWGDTPGETLDILQDVAAGIIETYIERGYELPSEVKSALVASDDASEVLISV